MDSFLSFKISGFIARNLSIIVFSIQWYQVIYLCLILIGNILNLLCKSSVFHFIYSHVNSIEWSYQHNILYDTVFAWLTQRTFANHLWVFWKQKNNTNSTICNLSWSPAPQRSSYICVCKVYTYTFNKNIWLLSLIKILDENPEDPRSGHWQKQVHNRIISRSVCSSNLWYT